MQMLRIRLLFIPNRTARRAFYAFISISSRSLPRSIYLWDFNGPPEECSSSKAAFGMESFPFWSPLFRLPPPIYNITMTKLIPSNAGGMCLPPPIHLLIILQMPLIFLFLYFPFRYILPFLAYSINSTTCINII